MALNLDRQPLMPEYVTGLDHRSGLTWGPLTNFMRRPDGGVLAVEVAGDLRGYPIILMHGSPGCRYGSVPDNAELLDRGVKLITYDRPGYGLSSPKPGRRPVDSVDDVRVILDHFGAPSMCSIIGRSGGGPHALACAARLEGVRNVAIISSGAPRDRQKVPEGLGQTNTADYAPETAARDIAVRVEKMRRNPSALLDVLAPDFTTDDWRALDGIGEHLLRSYDEAIRQDDAGWNADHAGLYDWGFSLGEIAVPTLVRYGGQDPFTPPSESHRLIREIPTAEGFYVPEASHMRTFRAVIPAAIDWCLTGEYAEPLMPPDQLQNPLRQAQLVLDKKGIQIVGVYYDPGHMQAQLRINFDTLSPENQARAAALVTAEAQLPSEKRRLTMATDRDGERTVAIRLPAGSNVRNIESYTTAIAAAFQQQPLTWAGLSAERIKEIFFYPEDDTSSSEQLARDTGTFLGSDGRFYLQENHLRRALADTARQ